MKLTPVEAQRRSDATERLLDEMRTGSRPAGHGAVTLGTYGRAWWDRKHERLGDRTPTEAIKAGDEAAVRSLIAEWYRASEIGGERRRNDPEFTALIRDKAEALRHTA